MMVFVLLIAFHLSCSHLCTRPLGLVFLFVYIPFPDIREIINHLPSFQICSFLDAIIPAVVIFLLTGSLVNRTLWLLIAHLCDNEHFSVTVKWGLNLEIMFLRVDY